MASSDEERFMPLIPNLQVPSIASTVPKVSLILDEPISNGLHTSHVPKCPGPEFRDFAQWSPKLPTSYPTNINRSSTPPSQNGSNFSDSSFKLDMLDLKRNISEIMSDLKSIRRENNAELMLELKNLQRESKSEVMLELSNLRREHKETLFQIREELRRLESSRNHAPTCSIATQTETPKKKSCSVLAIPTASHQAVQTEGATFMPVRSQSSESHFDSEGESDFDESDKFKEQLQQLIRRSEEQEDPPPPTTGQNGGAHNFERIQEIQRPIPRLGNHRMPSEVPPHTEVTLASDDCIKRYLPADEVIESRPRRQPERTPGKRFAVMNMTNVSFAMGYDGSLPGAEPYGAQRGHAFRMPTPPRYHHMENPRDYREQDEYGNYLSPRYEHDYGGFETAGNIYRKTQNRCTTEEGFQPVNRGRRNPIRDDVRRAYHTPPELDQPADRLRPRDIPVDEFQPVNREYRNPVRDNRRGYDGFPEGNQNPHRCDWEGERMRDHEAYQPANRGRCNHNRGGYDTPPEMDQNPRWEADRPDDDFRPVNRYHNHADDNRRDYGTPPERDRNENGCERILDLTAIRRLPKLL